MLLRMERQVAGECGGDGRPAAAASAVVVSAAVFCCVLPTSLSVSLFSTGRLGLAPIFSIQTVGPVASLHWAC